MPNFRHLLSRSQRVVYDRSDAITALRLRASARLARAVSLLPLALTGEFADEAERRRKVGKVAQVICDEICKAMRVSAARVVVKGVRPIQNRDEYHGLYVSEGRSHEITVWMYTAKRKHVVAPRTLLRTLLHEVAHHLDFHKLGLEESFHSDGFFKRESSLVRQVERAAAQAARQVAPAKPGRVPGPLALSSNRADESG